MFTFSIMTWYVQLTITFLVILTDPTKRFPQAQSEFTCGKSMIYRSLSLQRCFNSMCRFRRIVSGENSYHGQWPWMVSLKNPVLKQLLQENTKDYMNWSLVEPDSHICGGTLINAEWIITARHCLYYYVQKSNSEPILGNWSATLGLFNISKPSTITVNIPVDKVIYPNGFLGLNVDNSDFAMMHLSRPVSLSQYIFPACLPSTFFAHPGRICYSVGWGTAHSLSNPLVNPVLKHTMVKIMSKSESIDCVSQAAKEICASPVTGNVCRGDSGGPLLCQDEEMRWVLVGITVRGSGCYNDSDRSIFTSSLFLFLLCSLTSLVMLMVL